MGIENRLGEAGAVENMSHFTGEGHRVVKTIANEWLLRSRRFFGGRSGCGKTFSVILIEFLQGLFVFTLRTMGYGFNLQSIK